jgi:hypothetical protein
MAARKAWSNNLLNGLGQAVFPLYFTGRFFAAFGSTEPLNIVPDERVRLVGHRSSL